MSLIAQVKPYLQLMRLHQPVGVWLLFWPCIWGLTLASQGIPPLYFTALFFLGSVLMRSAGCIINDLWDRDFDAQVARTRLRPLASGAITPRQALILLLILLVSSLWILLQLPSAVFWLACLSLPLVVLYPAMKRITWWPQVFLGLTFNFGALMGWAALRESIDLPAIFLYLAGACWTLGYDTIYAHQDKSDDMKIGVKSTALLFAAHTHYWVAGFYVLMLIFLGLARVQVWQLALLALPLLVQLIRIDIDNPERCGRQFRFHALYGALVWIALLR